MAVLAKFKFGGAEENKCYKCYNVTGRYARAELVGLLCTLQVRLSAPLLYMGTGAGAKVAMKGRLCQPDRAGDNTEPDTAVHCVKFLHCYHVSHTSQCLDLDC